MRTATERELITALDHAERVIDVQREHIVAMERDLEAMKGEMRVVRYRRNLLDAHIPPGSSVHLIPQVVP